MKIAIPMMGNELSMHFGHCEQFALVDADPEKKNVGEVTMHVPPPHEPGVLPRWLHELGATVIIAGGMGMRAQQLFAQNGIDVVVGATALNAQQLAQNYLDGSLVTGQNVCDH